MTLTLIQQNLSNVREQIKQYAQEAGRHPQDITLIAVSKTVPAPALLETISHEQIHFGENYLQEALTKQQMLATTDLPPLTWHFIGPIQRNKTTAIATHFDWVHSVDRLLIAERLAQSRPETAPPLNICLQLNLDDESTKSGITSLSALHTIIEGILRLPHLQLRGFMCIPKPSDDFDTQRHAFRQLKTLLTQINEQYHLTLDTLSMGMSHDLKAAIFEGATFVRVGTAIFGKRPAI